MARIDYLDFDINIWSDEGGYRAQVTSPSGNSGIVTLQPFADASQLENLLLRLELAVERGRVVHRGPLSQEERLIQDFGRALFNMVFRQSPQISDLLAKSAMAAQQGPNIQGLRLRLRINAPELAMLPWEYVYDQAQEEYLCLRYQSPLVRVLDVPEPIKPLEVRGPLNILGMVVDNPGPDWTPLDADKERRTIEAAIGNLESENQIKFRWVQGTTPQHLLEAMQQDSWHVFHFIGHGGVADIGDDKNDATAYDAVHDGLGTIADGNRRSHTDGFVVLSDGAGGARPVYANELRLLLQGDGSLRVAILNCCDSARGDRVNTFASPAAALVRSGIPAVVAMQFPITDAGAISFAANFYKAIARNDTIEKAVTFARLAMRFDSKVEWAIPVLFTRSGSGKLFAKVRPKAAPSRSELKGQPVDVPAQIAERRIAQDQEAGRRALRRLYGYEG